MAPELWQAAVLGVVQGLTEFLPVSSTGHLILVPALFGWHGGVIDSLQFDVALHLGTLVALLAVFWRDWLILIVAALGSIARRSLADRQARLAWLILLGTIPGALAGALLQKQVETTLRSAVVIGAAMVLVALLLALVDRLSRQTRDEYSLGAAGAIAVGIGQDWCDRARLASRFCSARRSSRARWRRRGSTWPGRASAPRKRPSSPLAS